MGLKPMSQSHQELNEIKILRGQSLLKLAFSTCTKMSHEILPMSINRIISVISTGGDLLHDRQNT